MMILVKFAETHSNEEKAKRALLVSLIFLGTDYRYFYNTLSMLNKDSFRTKYETLKY